MMFDAFSYGLDAMPVVGNIKSLVEAVVGFDIITGEKLSRVDRGISLVGAVFPAAKSALKAGKAALKAYKVEKRTASLTSPKPSNPVCGGNCFPAGTMVETEDGPRAIESLKVGDKVLSQSDSTGEIEYTEVEQTITRIADEVYILTIGEEGRQLEVTGDHPFFVHDHGWVRTQNLKVGDELDTRYGMTLEVKDIQVKKKETKVYNLTVADYHSFFVTDLLVFTHNQGTCQININRQVGTEFEVFVEGKRLQGVDKAGQLDTQRSFSVNDLGQRSVKPDFVIYNKNGEIAAIGDAKTSPHIPFDDQAKGFIQVAQGSTSKKIVYYTPDGNSAIDPRYYQEAAISGVTIIQIGVK